MSTSIESLLARLRLAEQAAEQAEQRAEQAGQRAEQERQRAEAADLQVQQERQRTQMTTLEEYLRACHDHFQKALYVETNKHLTTKGFTSTHNKYYPKFLRPWAEFPEFQLGLFKNFYHFFHAEDQHPRRFFNSLQYIQELAQNLGRRKLASEKDLETYERSAVEDMVTTILDTLSGMPEAQAELDLEGKTVFENHTNSLSHVAEEVQQRLHLHTPRTRLSPTMSSSSSESGSTSQTPLKQPRTRADQFCVYREINGTQRLLFLVEYKPPHKLSIGNLRAGLRDMDLKKEVFDRVKIPVYKEKPEEQMTPADEDIRQEKLQYNADKLVAAVVTQTFHAMIDFGLEYSYITTGEAFVFLRIRWEDPVTLYYHLFIPGEDAEEKTQTSLAQTAISQVISMCIMASKSIQYSHTQRKDAKTNLQKYRIDYEAILREIPESERKQTPSVAYKGRKNQNPKRSPYLTRQRTRGGADRNQSDSSDEGGSPNTPSKTRGSSSRGKRVLKSTGGQSSSRGNDKGRQQTEGRSGPRSYCTQACLLGLAHRRKVDEGCPNIGFHRPFNGYHIIDSNKLISLVQEQLATDPEWGCKPLGLQGARGALFRITLLSHGYVLVAKGTVRAFVPDMLYEAQVYRCLETLQGTAIPVCFGYIRLRSRYYLTLGVKIRHMLLMSWGGEMIDDKMAEDHYEIQKTVQEVLQAGINQADLRSANLLWNEERRRIMLIDFERAIAVATLKKPLSKTQRGVLQDLSPNIRRKHYETKKVLPIL
ncbi:hypothetical protein MMC14_008916 [Varicellaria rhodocarpa]|nr:hypothetical protein [Varicellaria rhodocarpa]